MRSLVLYGGDATGHCGTAGILSEDATGSFCPHNDRPHPLNNDYSPSLGCMWYCDMMSFSLQASWQASGPVLDMYGLWPLAYCLRPLTTNYNKRYTQ